MQLWLTTIANLDEMKKMFISSAINDIKQLKIV
jgi:hypothetical protein